MMKSTALFFGLICVASALNTTPNHRPIYNFTIAGRSVGLRADQQLDCYDRINCEGIKITIGTNPVPDLAASPYYYDNRIVSCYYNGIYILYDGRNYNQDNLNGAVYAEAWGENNCVNMDGFAGKATSIRLSGAPNGWRYDTINFYEGETYNGQEQFFYGDSAVLSPDKFGRSMIITGCSPWTLYELQYYQGQSACWYPADTQNCYPSFFGTASKMNGWANQVSSVKHGCFSNQKYYGESLEKSGLKVIESQKGSKGHFLP